jgi:aminoglycoside N3'-acetyltransferase
LGEHDSRGDAPVRWFDDIEDRADLFAELGEDFERGGTVVRGRVGSGEARLFRQREAVDFAVEWLGSAACKRLPEPASPGRAL